MPNIRSTLKPYLHKQRRKWYPRGTFPIKHQDGTIERKRDFYGPSSDTRALCQADCDRLNRELEAAASSGPLEPTFEEAVATYLGTGGDKRFLGEVAGGPRNKLLDRLGSIRVNEISDAVMVAAAAALYPTATPVTVNRQLYTPVIAVLRMASKGKPWKPDLTRPKGHSNVKPAESPPDAWFAPLLPKCRPQLAAVLLFCTTTGRRGGEALRCLPEHYDPENGTVRIKDKSGNTIQVQLADEVREAFSLYNWQAGPGLFGHYTIQNRRNLFRDLEAACKRAGVIYYPPHKVGRHAFAKRFLAAGHSIAHLMGAGGWSDPKMPTMLYGHQAYSEVAEASKKVGDAFMTKLGETKDNVVELQPRQRRSVVTKR
jgi:integrase